MSFYTSLSGIQAAQTDMSAISHNLANVATNGFKKSSTSFGDVIASTANSNPTQLIGMGVVTKSVAQNFSQGSFVQSSSALDLGISGDGFFAVRSTGGNPQTLFTRNGSFTVDNDNYVTDSQGNRLQVYPVDGSGAVVSTSLDQTVNLRLPETSGVAVATNNVTLGMTVPANASIPSEADQFSDGSYAFDRFDPSTYNQSTRTTVYDANGKALTLTNYFVHESDDTGGGSTWKVYSFVGDQQLDASGGSSATPQAATLSFDSTGALTSPTGAVTLGGLTPTGTTAQQPISIDFSGSLQTGTTFSVDRSTQDGAAVGQFESVTVGDDGTVTASYSNGDNKILGKVVLATFANPEGLRQLGNSTWASTGLSGAARVGEPGANGFGSLMSGALEQSNVDLTEELVNLIAAQRNFQANAKALDTESQLSQTIFNIRS